MRLSFLLTALALVASAAPGAHAQAPDDSPLVGTWTVSYTHGETICRAAPFPIPVPPSPDETAVVSVVEPGTISVALPQETNVMHRVPPATG